MSDRAFIYSETSKLKTKVLAESKGFIPMLWIPMVMSSETACDPLHSFIVSGPNAIANLETHRSVILNWFPKAVKVGKYIRQLQSILYNFPDKLTIDLGQFLVNDTSSPDLPLLFDCIKRSEGTFTFVFPEQFVVHPISKKRICVRRKLSSAFELYLYVCRITAADLTEGDISLRENLLLGGWRSLSPSVRAPRSKP
jgi:hypothetical protein